MAVIKVLSSNIYNKIAAGEVVERPSSIIKELLDNSIDAGADEINIEIAGGGIKKILVKDNGSGIEKDFIKTAFLRHATSKISSENDLFNIKTLGFRGEALSSIAAVSMVDLKSKTKDDDIGTEIVLHGGEIITETEVAINTGTIFLIENLFYNTPVRLKFLKTARAEESEITNLISRYILANPLIKFTYKAENKIIFNTFGKDLKEAISQIYGRDVLNNLIPLDYTSNEGFNVAGYIGKPSYSKPNRTFQTLVINGRYVLNTTISSAITLAYNEYLMKRQYPFYILILTLPSDFLDVNVHPNKMDVRFEDNKKIFSLFYNCIYGKLLENTKTDNLNANIFNKSDDIKVLSNKNNLQDLSNLYSSSRSENNNKSFTQSILERYNKDSFLTTPSNLKISDVKIADSNNYYSDVKSDKKSINYNFDSVIVKDLNTENAFKRDNIFLNNNDDDSVSKNIDELNIINTNINKTYINEISEIDTKENIIDSIQENIGVLNNQNNFDFDIPIKICGTLFNTYIIAEYNNICYIIDQHAAHERLIFDKFVSSFQKGELAVQDLLVPYIFNVNVTEEIFFENHSEQLKKIGFGIDAFGDFTYRIFSVPAQLSQVNLNEFIKAILDEQALVKEINDIDFVREKIIQKACKAAVKAGDSLSENEIKILIKNLLKNTVLLCPHGRPVITTFTKYEIEKMFKRTI